MIKVLFVCHGNICRSPIGEFVMKKLVRDAGKEKEFHIFDQQIESGKNLLHFQVKLGGEIIKSNQITLNF